MKMTLSLQEKFQLHRRVDISELFYYLRFYLFTREREREERRGEGVQVGSGAEGEGKGEKSQADLCPVQNPTWGSIS